MDNIQESGKRSIYNDSAAIYGMTAELREGGLILPLKTSPLFLSTILAILKMAIVSEITTGAAA